MNCHRLLVLLVLGIFLSVGIPPVWSQISVSLSQNGAEELVEEGSNCYENEQLSEALESWPPEKLVNEGRSCYEKGQVSEAVESLEKAREIFPTQGNWHNLAITSTNLSRIFQELGQHTRACSTLVQALGLDLQFCQDKKFTQENLEEVSETFPQLPARIQVPVWRSFGDVLRAIGKLKESEIVLKEALNLANEPNAEAATRLSLGNTYRAMGNLERDRQAEPKYEYMPWRCESQENFNQEIQAYYQKATRKYEQVIIRESPNEEDDSSERKEEYQRLVIKQSKELPLSAQEIKAQLNLLSLLVETGKVNYAKNLSEFIQPSHLPKSRVRVYAYINLAKSLACLKQKIPTDNFSEKQTKLLSWEEINNLLETAFQDAKKLEDRRAASYALGNRGGLYEYFGWLDEQLQQEKKTKELSQEAQNLCQYGQECREQAKQWTEKALELLQQREEDETLSLVQLSETPDLGYQWQWQLGRLYEAQGKRKEGLEAYTAAAETLKSVRGDLLSINSDVQFSFRDNVEPMYRELVNLLLQEPIEENLGEARKFIQQLKVAELENFLRCSLQNQESVEIDKIIDRSGSTEAVIYPIVFENHIDIIFKLPQKILRYKRIALARSEVDEVLKRLGTNLREPDRSKDVERDAQEIYSWLISPIKSDLDSSNVKTLVFVLDTPLLSVPMAVLYDGERYLIENYAIAVTTGWQLQAPKTLERRNLRAILAGLTEASQGFPPLENVEAQFRTIKSEISSEVLLDKDFTVNSLQTKVKSLDFPIVHLASHGQFSSQPQETFIIAWDDKFDANGLSNLLKGREQTRPEPIELLALVACETAKGDKWAALGLAGVAVQSGARSTLATMWKVRADKSPGDLMSQFYRELKDPNVTKAEALQRAQQEFLKDYNRKLPYYWAAYVLIENWL